MAKALAASRIPKKCIVATVTTTSRKAGFAQALAVLTITHFIFGATWITIAIDTFYGYGMEMSVI